VETNQGGNFVFPDLPIGTYSIEAGKQGFTGQKREGISLLTGQDLELTFSLAVGDTSQTVQVTMPRAAPIDGPYRRLFQKPGGVQTPDTGHREKHAG
jgi:hypothetical protein